MTYIRIDKSTSPIVALGAIVPAFISTVTHIRSHTHKKESVAEPTSRATDKRTLPAIARLTNQQLDDIGIYRVPRIEPDHLVRNFNAERTVTFDYFRVES